MKWLLIIFCFWFFLIIPINHITVESNVYICNGKYAKKYHYSKSCRGLSNCKGAITKETLGEAKKMGRTLCGWED